MKKAFLFSLAGALLGFGAPLGALILLWLFPHPALQLPDFIVEEWQDHLFFFIYMLSGTSLVFSVFGFWIGKEEDAVLKRNRRLTDQVLTDPLTGLGNHRFLHDCFTIEFRKHITNRQPISCLMMDLDHFKRVNDTCGHPFGDYVLIHFAKIVQESIRQGDTACRYGGEEFLCVLPHCDSREALQVAERIREKTKNYEFAAGHHKTKITVSLGVVTSYKNSGVNYRHLIDLADKALYEAKHKGRNRVVQILLTRGSMLSRIKPPVPSSTTATREKRKS